MDKKTAVDVLEMLLCDGDHIAYRLHVRVFELLCVQRFSALCTCFLKKDVKGIPSSIQTGSCTHFCKEKLKGFPHVSEVYLYSAELLSLNRLKPSSYPTFSDCEVLYYYLLHVIMFL